MFSMIGDRLMSRMKIKYPKIGICGLSCRLCPNYQTDAKSRCLGCKSEARMAVGCPFITCAMKKKGVEFCWDCQDSSACEKWASHRNAGKTADSFKCYQKLEEDIAFISEKGVAEFERSQKASERLLRTMLREFNDGRSKSYYCIAATVLEIEELRAALAEAKLGSTGKDVKGKALLLRSTLDKIAARKSYHLKLRRR